MNIIDKHSVKNKLYVALSCIGALARTWLNNVPETKYGVEFYNDTGIRKMFEIEINIEPEFYNYNLK